MSMRGSDKVGEETWESIGEKMGMREGGSEKIGWEREYQCEKSFLAGENGIFGIL